MNKLNLLVVFSFSISSLTAMESRSKELYGCTRKTNVFLYSVSEGRDTALCREREKTHLECDLNFYLKNLQDNSTDCFTAIFNHCTSRNWTSVFVWESSCRRCRSASKVLILLISCSRVFMNPSASFTADFFCPWISSVTLPWLSFIDWISSVKFFSFFSSAVISEA